ncbi:protein lethal(2)essential for life-like isoform X1 [Ischnura elegans]|uniref:protein lethal(2)essential for life-like isoform X1 n=1 Tax=Ischnura elegans TaxID=197161 RepID=UPI001ED890AB|nr:protein lethal(2)essential for life-like isoform X1 [Ischnura elegans]
MSRHAMVFRPWFADNPWAPAPSHLFDQHFGVGMHMDDLFQPPYIPYHAPPTHHRPWRQLPRADDSRGAMDKDGFKIVVDVQHFKLGEITVKQEEDSVVVEGKHEETEDEHGFVSRHFLRRYTLPQGVDHQALNSTLSSDGVLTITAPKVKKTPEDNVRTVKIQQTGKPAIKKAEMRG